MKKTPFKLSKQDREQLLEMLRKGSLKSRTYKRITGLLESDKGHSYDRVSSVSHLSRRSLLRLIKKYNSHGLDCLFDEPRSGRPIGIDKALEDKIILLSCSEAPKGYGQWSLRLLADKVVELGYCDEISHTQVSKVLKKRKSNPT